MTDYVGGKVKLGIASEERISALTGWMMMILMSCEK